MIVCGSSTRLAGAIDLDGSHVSGSVLLEGGVGIGQSDTGHSLSLDGATVDGDLKVRGAGTELDGAIGLIVARVRGQITVSDSVVIGTDEVVVPGAEDAPDRDAASRPTAWRPGPTCTCAGGPCSPAPCGSAARTSPASSP